MKSTFRTFAIIFFAAIYADGCAPEQGVALHSPNPDIPPTAIYGGQSNGRLFFQATDTGVIYIYDADLARLVFAQPIKIHQRFVLDGRLQNATVEGKVVYEKPFDRDHAYRIYFDPNGTAPKPAEVVAPIIVTAKTPASAPAP